MSETPKFCMYIGRYLRRDELRVQKLLGNTKKLTIAATTISKLMQEVQSKVLDSVFTFLFSLGCIGQHKARESLDTHGANLKFWAVTLGAHRCSALSAESFARLAAANATGGRRLPKKADALRVSFTCGLLVEVTSKVEALPSCELRAVTVAPVLACLTGFEIADTEFLL